MKQTLKLLLASLFLVVLLPYAYEWFCFSKQASSQFFLQELEIIKQKQPPYVAIGSSRTLRGFIVEEEQKSKFVALGVPDLGMWGMDLLIRTHVQTLKKTQQLLIEMPVEVFLYHSLYKKQRVYRRLAQSGVPPWRLFDTWNEWSTYQVHHFFPLLSGSRWTPRDLFRRLLRDHNQIEKVKKEMQKKAEQSLTPLSREDFHTMAIEFNARVKENYSVENENKSIEIFKELMAFLQNEKVNFCVYRLPVSETFKKYRPFLSHQGALYYAQLFKAHRCFSVDDLDLDYKFQDPDHLTEQSAKALTSKVIEHLSR